MGICALLFLALSLAGKFSDKLSEITRLDPRRGRRIAIMMLVTSAELTSYSPAGNVADKARDRTPDSPLALIQSVRPLYSPLAKQARVQGTVRLSAIIGVNGQVEELHLIDGNPMLVPAAEDAVRQWVYRKPTAGGRPIRVKTGIELNFRLEGPN